MTANDILKEVLKDENLINILKISKKDIESASMDERSDDQNVEIVRTIIKGYFNGRSKDSIFRDIKLIKEI